MTATETNLEWCERMFDEIEPTADAAFAFDMSDDGKRYYSIARCCMVSNLGLWSELSSAQQSKLNEVSPA